MKFVGMVFGQCDEILALSPMEKRLYNALDIFHAG